MIENAPMMEDLATRIRRYADELHGLLNYVAAQMLDATTDTATEEAFHKAGNAQLGLVRIARELEELQRGGTTRH